MNPAPRHQLHYWSFLFLLLPILYLQGCANIELSRKEVESIGRVEVIRSPTPPLEVNTFIHELAKQQPGLLTHMLERGKGEKVRFSSQEIPDVGAMLAEKVYQQLPKLAPWWPVMEYRTEPVQQASSRQLEPWLHVEIVKNELAPVFGTLLIVAEVSLRRPYAKPLWLRREIFSGAVHGGESIDVERIKSDQSQLHAELERAAGWLANEILLDLR